MTIFYDLIMMSYINSYLCYENPQDSSYTYMDRHTSAKNKDRGSAKAGRQKGEVYGPKKSLKAQAREGFA